MFLIMSRGIKFVKKRERELEINTSTKIIISKL